MFEVNGNVATTQIPLLHTPRKGFWGWEDVMLDEITAIAEEFGLGHNSLIDNDYFQSFLTHGCNRTKKNNAPEGFFGKGERKIGEREQITWFVGNMEGNAARWNEIHHIVEKNTIEPVSSEIHTKGSAMEISLGGGWEICTNFDPLRGCPEADEVIDIWTTYKKELNDTPLGKAALRSYAARKDGSCCIVRNLHLREGLLWNPSKTTPSLWEDRTATRGNKGPFSERGVVLVQSYTGGINRGTDDGEITGLLIGEGKVEGGRVTGRPYSYVYTNRQGVTHRSGGKVAFYNTFHEGAGVRVYAENGRLKGRPGDEFNVGEAPKIQNLNNILKRTLGISFSPSAKGRTL